MKRLFNAIIIIGAIFATSRCGVNEPSIGNNSKPSDFTPVVEPQQVEKQSSDARKAGEEASKLCGTHINIQCAAGYTCKIIDDSDHSGICVK